MFLSRGDRDLGVAFQTHPGTQAFISSGSKEPRSALESRRVPLSPAGVPCAFSPQSQAYFALASADGHLRVWETANNRLHQEYVPSAHLSGTCTCLAWAPARLQAKVK